jgi:hypothetical protein
MAPCGQPNLRGCNAARETDMKWLITSAAAVLFAGLALQSTARADDYRSERFPRYYASANSLIHFRVPLPDPPPVERSVLVNRLDMVSLNPQPLPPGRQLRFGGLTQFGR